MRLGNAILYWGIAIPGDRGLAVKEGPVDFEEVTAASAIPLIYILLTHIHQIVCSVGFLTYVCYKE